MMEEQEEEKWSPNVLATCFVIIIIELAIGWMIWG